MKLSKLLPIVSGPHSFMCLYWTITLDVCGRYGRFASRVTSPNCCVLPCSKCLSSAPTLQFFLNWSSDGFHPPSSSPPGYYDNYQPGRVFHQIFHLLLTLHHWAKQYIWRQGLSVLFNIYEMPAGTNDRLVSLRSLSMSILRPFNLSAWTIFSLGSQPWMAVWNRQEIVSSNPMFPL